MLPAFFAAASSNTDTLYVYCSRKFTMELAIRTHLHVITDSGKGYAIDRVRPSVCLSVRPFLSTLPFERTDP